MDGGGAIGLQEFAMMLRVMGCEIDIQQVRHVMDEAKDGFSAWKKMACNLRIQNINSLMHSSKENIT